MTIPRLRGLMDAYTRRHHRDLYDLGSVIALAFHKPDALQTLTPPKPAGVTGKQRGWWEQTPS